MLQSHFDGQKKHQREMKQVITRINQSAAGILSSYATASTMSEKAQLRDLCYAATVSEQAPALPEDDTASSDSPKMNPEAGVCQTKTSPADFQEMLSFLFGE